jgi:hypothetical protein
VELIEIVLLILLSVAIVVALIILYYVKHPKYRKQKRTLLVSPAIARHSRKVLRGFCYRFEKRYGRQPNQSELIRRIIRTSHIVDKRPTWQGHWHRWRIRMFLASENGVWYGKRAANNIKIININDTLPKPQR